MQVIEGDDGALTVAGTSLARFLRGRSAYYLLADEVNVALDCWACPHPFGHRRRLPKEDANG